MKDGNMKGTVGVEGRASNDLNEGATEEHLSKVV